MLKNTYVEQIRPKLQNELGLGIMAVPKIEKVVLDMGVGEGTKNKELVESLGQDLTVITGQKAQVRKAARAVSGFGVREGDPVGLKATLRGVKMYDFLEKLIKIVLPRVRDFRGIKRTSFDGWGNYTLGLTDHTIFPEIEFGRSAKPWGLGITIVTTTPDDKKAEKLLEELGMPFEKSSTSGESKLGSKGGKSSG